MTWDLPTPTFRQLMDFSFPPSVVAQEVLDELVNRLRTSDRAAAQERFAATSWFEPIVGVQDIPDLTCGRWPAATCDVRSPLIQLFVCTRIAHHTGRHAAGNGSRIVAVWGDLP